MTQFGCKISLSLYIYIYKLKNKLQEKSSSKLRELSPNPTIMHCGPNQKVLGKGTNQSPRITFADTIQQFQ